jgi:hypothetical protein
MGPPGALIAAGEVGAMLAAFLIVLAAEPSRLVSMSLTAALISLPFLAWFVLACPHR